MKFSTSLIVISTLVVTLASFCKLKKATTLFGFIERKIELDGGLGTITVNLPSRLNKYNHWADTSTIVYPRTFYRFHDENYPFVKDKTGSTMSYELDSLYQFSVWQTAINSPGPKQCFTKTDSISILEEIIQPPEYFVEHLKREFRMIDNRLFTVEVKKINSLADGKSMLMVAGSTCLKGKKIFFMYECRGKDTTGFFSNMYNSVLSIKIDENAK